MTLLVKFAGFFAVLGLVISVIFGLVGGNRISSLIVTALISTGLSALIGAGVHQILEKNVPEFLSIFEGSYVESEDEAELAPDSEPSGMKGLEEEEDDLPIASSTSSSYSGLGDSGEMPAARSEKSEDGEMFGEHILVHKVKIKNEPKLIAQAIRTMMAKDS